MDTAGAVLRVQTLSQTQRIPSQYIQPPHHRPSPTTLHHTTVPVISLSSPNLLRSISLACADWGAFQVTNHGVRVRLLDDMRRVCREWFEGTELEEKLRYKCDEGKAAAEGYGTRMLVKEGEGEGEGEVLDWRDYFDHHTWPMERRRPERWPGYPIEYREVVGEYSNQMKALAEKLLGLISESLGARSSCILDAIGEIYQNITVSYYPPCPQPELTLGLQAHSDIGVITLLIQDDTGGLQVFKDGEWITVEPITDAIVVILADQTEIITNGAYRSAEHRAITNANRARLSVATFHDPAKTRKISPASDLIGESSPPKYREVVYGDYFSSWYTKGPEGKRNLDALLL
ncbi:Jasmonate-induced oxygenase 4-like protein [Drosera capensis]